MDVSSTRLIRPSNDFMDGILGTTIPILDKGFIRVVDYMGDQDAIVQAARVSYGKGVEGADKDIPLIRYLMRNWHTTPFEMCEIKLHVKLPIFVARQWIRHRTANINEISGRYVKLPEEYYVPEEFSFQSTDNKQGQSGPIDPTDNTFLRDEVTKVSNGAFQLYSDMADDVDPTTGHDSFGSQDYGYGVSKEQSRMHLPLSTYTEMYWKIDLHNLLHFLRLRTHAHAQVEIRDYADAMLAVVSSWLPDVYAAYLEYVINSHTFSASEMAAIRKAMNATYCEHDPLETTAETFSALQSDVSKREYASFVEALGIGALQ